MQVQKNRHRFVATPSIQAEWKTHASGFATRWLASMFARRLVEKLEDDPVVPTLRQAISQRWRAAVPNSGGAVTLRLKISTSSRQRWLPIELSFRGISKHCAVSACPKE